MSESPFLEDQALHAALAGRGEDDDDLDVALDKMLPGELMALADACDVLSVAARRKSYAKRNLDRYGQKKPDPAEDAAERRFADEKIR